MTKLDELTKKVDVLTKKVDSLITAVARKSAAVAVVKIKQKKNKSPVKNGVVENKKIASLVSQCHKGHGYQGGGHC